MRQKVRVKEKAREHEHVAEDKCHHYWIIEIANGPKSKGVCKYCGEWRDFFNSMTYLSALKKDKRPLDLPEMSDVKLDDDSES